MSALRDMDKMDIMDIINILKLLKIPCEGLTTLDEMKAKVKETLQLSEEKSSWTAKEVRILQYIFKIWTTSKLDL